MDSKTLPDNLISLSKERALRRRRERERSWRDGYDSSNLETRLKEVEIRLEHAVSRLVEHIDELFYKVDILSQRQKSTLQIIQRLVDESSKF